MKKILIIDDEPDLVKMISIRLTTSGYSVITAGDGEEGLKIARENSPDLILLDVMMPKIDGYKFCGLLKGDSRHKNIPVIILTARAGQESMVLSQEVGADAYINKPVNSEELLGKIKELLEASGKA